MWQLLIIYHVFWTLYHLSFMITVLLLYHFLICPTESFGLGLSISLFLSFCLSSVTCSLILQGVLGLRKALPAISLPSTMAALTNSGAEVLGQGLDTHGEGVQTPAFPLDVMYETQRCIEWIRKQDYQRVSVGVFIIAHFC